GPCGPCLEIYFDTKMENIDKDFVKKSILNGEDRFLEIWNLVFMEYNQTENGLEVLPQKCIDTGMGLERILSVVNFTFDNFESDTLKPIVNEVNKKIKNLTQSKIIADHMKSIVFLIGEGITPKNSSQGYVLRNLIRRSLLYSENLCDFVDVTIDCLEDYSKNFLSINTIKKVIKNEENDFKSTLKKAMEILKKIEINEENIFKMHDTYGIPFELLSQFLRDKEISIDWNKVKELKLKHNEVSKRKLIIDLNTPTIQKDYDINECKSKIIFLGELSDDLLEYKKTNKISFEETKNESQNDKFPSKKFVLISEESCFYGRGGGQEGDRGLIFNENCNIFVLDTLKQKISADLY
ncbi:MAG: alanine--tRNA ligase-related protein, partial [Bacteroidota bacterium]